MLYWGEKSCTRGKEGSRSQKVGNFLVRFYAEFVPRVSVSPSVRFKEQNQHLARVRAIAQCVQRARCGCQVITVQEHFMYKVRYVVVGNVTRRPVESQ